MKSLNIILFAVMAAITACKERVTSTDLQKFAPTEVYPDDVYLNSVSPGKALVIVAHDDDDCAMSGTIAKLTDAGWNIKQLSLQNHLMPGEGKNPAGIICSGNELILEDGFYRKGLDTIKSPYLPIPYEEIRDQFLTEKVATAITEKVQSFRPTVIFTLDNVKGGYGHPEHIFISQLVKDLYEAGTIETGRIYQSVYTNSMEAEIVDKWLAERMKKWGFPHSSSIANELYGIDGMPEPTVQINITEVAPIKMKYLRAYDEDVRKNLRKFIPYFEEFDAEEYFNVFDREFFRVISKETLP